MNNIVIFESGDQGVQVRLEGETLWLTQRQMAEVFATTPENVLMHLKNIFREGELDEAATAKDFLAVRQEGARQVRRRLKHYNLDAIISIGYRVNSTRATRFRQWATQVLRQHLTQGYSLDRERFEQNAAELEAALLLVRKAAAGQALTADLGRGLVDVIARYTHTFFSSSKTIRLPMATSAAALFCLWIFWLAMAACCAMARRSSTMWGWPRWRCWWPNRTRKTKT